MNLMRTGMIALKFLRRNAPIFISAAAGIGLVALYILTIKETEKAVEEIQEVPEGEDHDSTVVKKIIKIYAPSFICLLFTLACIICSTVISQHRIRDLTLYASSIAASYQNYRNLNIEKNGEEADAEVMRECVKMVPKDEVPPWEEDEDEVLCLMAGLPQWFYVHDISDVSNAFSEANKGYLEEGNGEVTVQQLLDLAEARIYDNKHRLIPVDKNYAFRGWGIYDLKGSRYGNAIYPRIDKVREDSGLEYYFIDVPVPKPIELVRWHY